MWFNDYTNLIVRLPTVAESLITRSNTWTFLTFLYLTLNDFNLLNGAYVNLAYPLPNGTTAQFLMIMISTLLIRLNAQIQSVAMVLLQTRSSFLFANMVIMVPIRK